MLNVMVSHRLADVICNGLIETLTLAMICFRAFARDFFMNENDTFFLKKKKKKVPLCVCFFNNKYYC